MRKYRCKEVDAGRRFDRGSSCIGSDRMPAFPPPSLSVWTMVASVQIADFLAILFSVVGPKIIAHPYELHPPGLAAWLFAVAFSCGIVAWCALGFVGAYRITAVMSVPRAVAGALLAWGLTTAPVVAVSMLHNPAGAYFRAWTADWLFIALAWMICFRIAVAMSCRCLIRLGLAGDAVIILGGGAAAELCARNARRHPGQFAVLGCFYDHETSFPTKGVPWLGDLAGLETFLARVRVDVVIVAASLTDSRQRRVITAILQRHPVRVMAAATAIELLATLGLPGKSHPHPDGFGFLPVIEPPLSGWAWIVKDIQDRTLALAMLLFMAPLMLTVALAIRVSSPGPVIFRQIRQGYAGREFRIWKFRSMHVNASRASGELALTARHDARVFPVGAFLRRTSIDELPQLFNVLAGDMWLVGPRPHSPFARAAEELYADVVADYPARHRVKPGITGWAQINGYRGPTETLEQIRQRVKYDLQYIENWSILLDFWIILNTLPRGVMNTNAF